MKKNSITTAITLKSTRMLKDGKFPVLLRITYQRKQYFVTVRDSAGQSILLTQNEFRKIFSNGKSDDKLLQLKFLLTDIQQNAQNIATKLLNEYEYFSLEAFRERFFDKEPEHDPKDLFISLKQRADMLKSEGRISTASCLMCALQSLKQFTEAKALKFEKCTPKFFEKYEKWFIDKGGSLTTVGIYLRNVRTVFNQKIIDGVLPADQYPFRKYQIPTGANIKKALTFEQLQQVAAFRFSGENQYRNYYKDLWMFSYLCNGMNIKDVVNLKYADIDNDFICYKRQKTIRASKKQPKLIEIPIHQETGRIMDLYGTKTGKYIFPILKDGMTPENQYRAVQQMVQNINKTMALITDLLELPKITTYTARHTFATVLKRSGVSVEFIQESLGHRDKQTTENYLSNFEREAKKAVTNKLL